MEEWLQWGSPGVDEPLTTPRKAISLHGRLQLTWWKMSLSCQDWWLGLILEHLFIKSWCTSTSRSLRTVWFIFGACLDKHPVLPGMGIPIIKLRPSDFYNDNSYKGTMFWCHAHILYQHWKSLLYLTRSHWSSCIKWSDQRKPIGNLWQLRNRKIIYIFVVSTVPADG